MAKPDQLNLEKFSENDFDYFYQLVGDEKTMEMITEKALTVKEAMSEFSKIVKNNKLHPNLGNFKIIDTRIDDFVGLAKLEIDALDSLEAELGYIILPAHWRKGIAGAVAKKLLEVAKGERQIKKVKAIIDPKNIPSRKILIKNNFVSKEMKEINGLPGEVLELLLND